MENDEIYNWLDRPFHELNEAEQKTVLREMDVHEYAELHALHRMSEEEASYHLREAENIAIPPLIRRRAMKIGRIPFWAAAACVALAVICTRVFWTREIEIPITIVKYDTVRLREVVASKDTDTLKVFVRTSDFNSGTATGNPSAKPLGMQNAADIGPELGEIQTGVVETHSVPSGQRSLSENELARKFRYVRM